MGSAWHHSSIDHAEMGAYAQQLSSGLSIMDLLLRLALTRRPLACCWGSSCLPSESDPKLGAPRLAVRWHTKSKPQGELDALQKLRWQELGWAAAVISCKMLSPLAGVCKPQGAKSRFMFEQWLTHAGASAAKPSNTEGSLRLDHRSERPQMLSHPGTSPDLHDMLRQALLKGPGTVAS